MIFYQIHTDNEGKNRAVNAKIEGVAALKPRVKRKIVKTQGKNNGFYQLFLSIILISTGFFSSLISYPKEEKYRVDYTCDGKIYCSEMTSCEEAAFYQQNCLDTKRDDDEMAFLAKDSGVLKQTQQEPHTQELPHVKS